MSFVNIPSYTWQSAVDTVPELPDYGAVGDVRLVVSTGTLYYFDGSTWTPMYSSISFANSFTIMQTPLGTSPTATSPTDTLTFTSSDGSIIITGDAVTDTIDLVSVGGGGAQPASVYMFSRNSSDISGYFELKPLSGFTAGALQTASQVSSTTPTLLAEFASEVNRPNTNAIPSGLLS